MTRAGVGAAADRARDAATDWARGRSLRWRVTAFAVVVVAVALLVIGAIVDLTLAAQLRRDQNSLLDDRLARAGYLVGGGVSGDQVLPRVGGQGVRARIVDASGRGQTVDVGSDVGAHRDAEDAPIGPAGPPGRPGRPRVLERRLPLPDGTTLVLSADPEENDGVLRRLRTVMVVVGALGLVVTAFVLLGGVRVALRPLESMTGLARDITRGDRGRRLRPARTDTELGRTAQAFDEMLDALETAQARAEDAAAEARRSEATTRHFLSDAAHELRTPITGVQSLAETLVRHPDVELERRERIATTLVRETRRAGALVADMLELARIEGDPVLDRRAVDLVALAEGEAERTALMAPSVTVTVVGDGPVTVRADPARVTQILANLLDNARRHGPAAGTIRIEVAAGERASVVVADEGAGVPPEDRERIFDRLVRLDDARTRDGGGAGLGLSIARALARAHGGDLVVGDSASGARFVLTLPAAEPDG